MIHRLGEGGGAMTTAIHERYTKEIYDGLGYFAVWMPNSPVSLGDVGVLRGRRFHRMTSLAELGVAFETVGPGVPMAHSYSSAGDVDVAVTGEVGTPEVLGLAPQLTITVTFHKAHATYLRAVGCTEEVVGDHLALQRGVADLREAGVWRREYVIVTKLVKTGPAVILVSSSGGTRVEFQASVDLAPMSLPLASVGAGLGTSTGSALAAEAVTLDGGLTPLFELSALRRGLSARPRLRIRGPGAGTGNTATDTWKLAPLSWEDFAQDSVSPV
ncbi:hypothetical protein [Streptomyces sp. NBC_01334]|uniref:hypothetical protein n=1 Tax=Streptomyces sp. NBC_01334 TaxID=2903827 RepID=UPI002E1501A2|nr:hypothetical protein OG736_02630 [Streptomyces sp. NBC_01334]